MCSSTSSPRNRSWPIGWPIDPSRWSSTTTASPRRRSSDRGTTASPGSKSAAQFELDRLAPRAALGIAVSRLRRAGTAAGRLHPNPGHPGGPRVVPRPNRTPPPSNGCRPTAAGEGRRWLSVGRLAPNKAHHQTIAALFVARAPSDPDARLMWWARRRNPPTPEPSRGMPLLWAWPIRSSSSPASPTPSWPPTTGTPTYWSCSRTTKGSACPLVEAMRQGLPIVAYDAGAVGETLGWGGGAAGREAPRQVAAAVSRLHGRPRGAGSAGGRREGQVRGAGPGEGRQRRWWRPYGGWRTGLSAV